MVGSSHLKSEQIKTLLPKLSNTPAMTVMTAERWLINHNSYQSDNTHKPPVYYTQVDWHRQWPNQNIMEWVTRVVLDEITLARKLGQSGD